MSKLDLFHSGENTESELPMSQWYFTAYGKFMPTSKYLSTVKNGCPRVRDGYSLWTTSVFKIDFAK